MIKKILIGIDDSTYAENATKYGFNLAGELGAHVGLVHMVEPVAIPTASTGADEILGSPIQSVNVMNTEILDAQQQMSEDILDRTTKKYSDKFEITQFNEFGSTGEGIIECSKTFKADLIIIGTHNRTGLDRLFNGSIAEYVVRHSHIPVLVVPLGE